MAGRKRVVGKKNVRISRNRWQQQWYERGCSERGEGRNKQDQDAWKPIMGLVPFTLPRAERDRTIRASGKRQGSNPGPCDTRRCSYDHCATRAVDGSPYIRFEEIGVLEMKRKREMECVIQRVGAETNQMGQREKRD